MTRADDGRRGRSWPDYAAVWRWHFYAALFSLPFICWLAITGTVYLFRPDIEAWLDSPYESLHLEGARATPSDEVRAAIAAVPGSEFVRYEPAATPTGAAQVVVARDGVSTRVYVHPSTLRAMNVVRDDHRLMDLVAHLHGNLLLDEGGSMVVELAGSWGVVMILTGLYLWLPRGTPRLGGVLVPRLGQHGRIFWRDLHAVTGVWISTIALFMLLSGLPWSSNWGHYLIWIRSHWPTQASVPAWPVGGKEQPASGSRASAPIDSRSGDMPGMTDAGMRMATTPGAPQARREVRDHPQWLGLDRVVPIAARLGPPRPVWISPPAPGSRDWTIESRAQNRPLRVTYRVSADTGLVLGAKRFADENSIDQAILVMIAAHEGQLFGRINQAIVLLTALGLLLVSISAIVMWWRRRPAGVLGAPTQVAPPRFSALLALTIPLLALLLPLFGLSFLVVIAVDRMLMTRLPAARRWMGLAPR